MNKLLPSTSLVKGVSLLIILGACLSACISTKVTILDDYGEPLREQVLQGHGRDKILMIPIQGFISSQSGSMGLALKPSVVEEVSAHFELAARDEAVKAVVLQINSPGGTTTGSDILYREIQRFRRERNVPVVACLMELATSGGYYAALAADHIVAHPTSVTGSVGTVFMQPRIDGLMDKVGVRVETYASGRHKDMGSFFRSATDEEKQMFQELITEVNERFLTLVRDRRRLLDQDMAVVAQARIFSGAQALDRGLVDRLGGLRDALELARSLGGLPSDSRVVAYRRTIKDNDTIYNTATSSNSPAPGLLGLDLSRLVPETGFYHLWVPPN